MSQFSCYDYYLYLHQIIIIFIIIINFTIVSDLEPVLESIITVTDWYTLGLKLGLSDLELQTIAHKETDRKREMIVSWLETRSGSWSSLVEALKSPLISRMDIAHQIMKDHLDDSSKYDIHIYIKTMRIFIIKYIIISKYFMSLRELCVGK